MSSIPALDRSLLRRNFSQHAGDYDRYARVQKRVAGRLMDEIATVDLLPGRVLDVGTGTGELARRFHQRYPNLPLLLCDLAHGMTCAAHESLPYALALDADAHQLPLAAGSVTLVLSSSVFQWVEDLEQVFAECARVLAPGGRFAFALFGEQTLWQLRESFRLARERTDTQVPDYFHSYPSLERVEQALSKAGFDDVRCFSEEEREYHPGVRELLISLKQIGAQNASQERPRGLFPRKVMLEMTSLYGERFSDERGCPASYEVIYGVVRKGRVLD